MFTTKIAVHKLSAETVEELQKKFVDARDYESEVVGAAGCSELGCMFDVISDGKVVGKISYNGKFWGK